MHIENNSCHSLHSLQKKITSTFSYFSLLYYNKSIYENVYNNYKKIILNLILIVFYNAKFPRNIFLNKPENIL